ncbi:hypothetical protein Cantr_00659 [Candida viswanathii]|uniref:Uncharacterized protein n=1 Tax=Candida viswanathii TaxID=5486 RepID=A0A367YG63_9ASCO|nr:hypothetical protein Cantr_00659 [Candida viswanathii]
MKLRRTLAMNEREYDPEHHTASPDIAILPIDELDALMTKYVFCPKNASVHVSPDISREHDVVDDSSWEMTGRDYPDLRKFQTGAGETRGY